MPREKNFGDVGENAGVCAETVEAGRKMRGEERKGSTYCEKGKDDGETLKAES
jgi:hypothetical protein